MDAPATRRAALMSIRPLFASAILSGAKRVEFRKRRLAEDIATVIIYMTAPVMAVVGEFTVAQQVVSTPAEMWERYAEVGGIDEDGFFSYFDGSEEAFGIVIDDVIEYETPRPLADIDPGGRPPQSVKYLALAVSPAS